MKSLALLVACVCVLLGEALPHRLDVNYTISYGIFDGIAESSLHFERRGGRYRIRATAGLKGFAAMMAHHHREIHTSKGIVTPAGKLRPLSYTNIRLLDGFRRERRYRFDYPHRCIWLTQTIERNVTTRRFDAATFTWRRDVNKSRHTGYYRLNYFAQNDLLTLYFNARELLRRSDGALHVLAAVGSRDGKIRLQSLRKGASGTKLLDAKLRYFARVFIEQDIFRSAHGELYIGLDDALLVDEAVLKDVFLFGDLKVKRTGVQKE